MNIIDAINWKGVIIIWSFVLGTSYLVDKARRIQREKGKNRLSTILDLMALILLLGGVSYSFIALVLLLCGNSILIDILH